MYLDETNLEYWCTQKNDLFQKNRELSERFNKIETIFNWIQASDQKISIENNEVKIGNSPIKIDNRNPYIKMFGPAIDEMTEDRKLAGILNQIEAFNMNNEIKEHAKNILLMMGGFNFNESPVVIDKFRLLSSSLKSLDFNGSVTSSGQSSWPNSHFSDNTYFFHLANSHH